MWGSNGHVVVVSVGCHLLLTSNSVMDDTKVGEMVIKEAEGTIAVLKADIEKAIVDAMALAKEIDGDCQA